jgi:cellulose synthase operon protein B
MIPSLPVLRALVLAAALLAPAGADAQSGSGAAIQIPLPGAAPAQALGVASGVDVLAARLAREAQRSHALANEAAPAPTLLSPLRPVRARAVARGSALRFDGERRSLDFALYLPEPQRLRALRVATLSSINVLPERSTYRVFLNDALLGEARLEHFTGPGVAEFPVPAGLARAGDNAVRIELVQQHRIFCGPEASFALWSDVDLALSGGVLDSSALYEGPEAFMLGLASTGAIGAGLEIRGAEILGEQRDAWIGHVTQRIAAALGGDPMPFRFTRTWSTAAPVQARARITFLPAAQPGVRFAQGGDGAQVMIVSVPPGTGPLPLPEFEALFPVVPRQAQVPTIETQRPVRLAEMGFSSIELRDRYSWTDVRFRLPDDYVILTNQKSQMTLTYIYADGLPYGSVLQIYINGVNIRVLPLRGEAGRVITDFPVRFEARHLRGGVNVIGFEVMVPGDPADLPCPPREAPVVAISDSSTIVAPYSPSMYLPDMHFAFTALTPGSVRVGDLAGRAYSALETLTLRAAFVTGQRPDAQRIDARLNLLAFEDLGAMPLGRYAFSRQAIEAVFTPLALPSATPEALAVVGLFRTEGARSPSVLAAGWDWLIHSLEAAAAWMHPHSGAMLDLWLSAQRGQAVLFQLDPLRPDEIWLLRAPGTDANALAAAMTAARATGDGPRGQVAVLGHDGRWSNWVAPDREPLLLEPLTLSNMRHALGNFVSAMPVRYVTGLFFLALISAIFALRFVISTRES